MLEATVFHTEIDSSTVNDTDGVKVDITKLKKQSKTGGNNASCSVNELEKIKNDDTTTVKSTSLAEGGKLDFANSTQVVKNVLAGNHSCLRNVNVVHLNDKCAGLKTSINQQKTVFGFLPISNLKWFRISDASKPNKFLSDNEFDPVTVHELVKSTGKPNFEEAKIQLPSKINFDLLDRISQDYWDYQVPLSLRYGFPFGFFCRT